MHVFGAILYYLYCFDALISASIPYVYFMYLKQLYSGKIREYKAGWVLLLPFEVLRPVLWCTAQPSCTAHFEYGCGFTPCACNGVWLGFHSIVCPVYVVSRHQNKIATYTLNQPKLYYPPDLAQCSVFNDFNETKTIETPFPPTFSDWIEYSVWL